MSDNARYYVKNTVCDDFYGHNFPFDLNFINFIGLISECFRSRSIDD